jgi:hypothetical protein
MVGNQWQADEPPAAASFHLSRPSAPGGRCRIVAVGVRAQKLIKDANQGVSFNCKRLRFTSRKIPKSSTSSRMLSRISPITGGASIKKIPHLGIWDSLVRNDLLRDFSGR